MTDLRNPPDYRLDPPEEPEPPCPHHWYDPTCDCEPDFDPPDSEPRPRTRLELEDALLPMATCATCGRSLTTTEPDWPGDGDVCTECTEMASDAEVECPETRRTGA